MPDPRGTVAYVLKGFPRLSELFIASEIRRVEEAGLPLALFVLKPCDETVRHAVVDEIRSPTTYLPDAGSISALSARRWLARYGRRFAPALARVARRRPLGLARACAAALAQAVRARKRRLGWPRRLYLKELAQAVGLADRVLARGDVAHLHAHFGHGATTVAWLAAQITGLSLSFTAHAKDIYDPSLNPAGLLERKMRAARLVVTCTEANRTHLLARAPGAPVVRVYHGLNADLARLLAEDATPRRPPPRPLRILMVGRLVSKKGFDVLVRACAELDRRAVPFVVRHVGEDGDAGAALRVQVAELGLHDRVTFLGPMTQHDLLREYRGATVLCAPCRIVDGGDRDGIPNVLVEAMACGVPVVTTPVSGIPELVDHGHNGLIVPPDDAAALADALDGLAADTAAWTRLSNASVETVRGRFDGRVLGRRLATLLQNALDGTPPADAGLLGTTRVFAAALRRRTWMLVASAALVLLGVGASLLAPWPLRLLIDGVLTPGMSALPGGWSAATAVPALAAAHLVVASVASLAAYTERLIDARVREGLTLDVRDRMLAHLATLAPDGGMGRRSGEIVHRLVTDAQIYVRCLTKTLPQVVRHAATTVATLGAMTLVAPLFGAIGLASVVALGIFARRWGASLGRVAQEKRAREGAMAGVGQELVQALPSLQASGEIGHARGRFLGAAEAAVGAGVAETRVTLGMERSLQVAQAATIALVTGFGGLLVVRGALSIGALTMVIAYVTQLLKPVEKVNELASALAGGSAAARRVSALLAAQPQVRERPEAPELAAAHGAIDFRGVHFAYPSDDRRDVAVLRGVDVTFAPGALHVITGRSGAGKSTLLALLTRSFDPTAGEIRIDGVPIHEVTLASLRRQIAVLTQRPHVFAGTIRDALQPWPERVDDDELLTALRLVALDAFVAGLPAGLDTQIGEDGATLSGGQRQRLALARAVLTRRPLLLLDEPTASVDRESERIIVQALRALLPERTCIAISHRSALVEEADALYRLEQGRLVHCDTGPTTAAVPVAAP